MASKRNVIMVVLLFMVAITACSKSPEAARKELGQMNIDYTEDSFIKYIIRGDKVVVEFFLNAGMSPNLRGYRFPPLHLATSEGHNEIVKLLIAKGADVNARTNYGWTPLLLAADSGNAEIVKVLLSKGADVNEQITDGDFRGWTPLRFAVSKKKEYRNPELVKTMVSKGGVNDKNLREALLIAKNIGYTEAVDILKKAGAKE